MILNLVSPSDPILRKKTERWDFDNPPMDLEELVENLCDTMVKERGVGLSANQCGIPYSVFVIGHPDTPEEIICVVNPKIVDHSNNIVLGEEGCLTWQGLFGKVKRYDKIRVRFANPKGVVETAEITGFTARAFQHEYDHLQGITYLDRMSKYHQDAAKRQQKKLMKLRKRNAL
jgi:peptide deformylase